MTPSSTRHSSTSCSSSAVSTEEAQEQQHAGSSSSNDDQPSKEEEEEGGRKQLPHCEAEERANDNNQNPQNPPERPSQDRRRSIYRDLSVHILHHDHDASVTSSRQYPTTPSPFTTSMGTATASSELVMQLQRLCQRQRMRSEERSFVRDVERVLVLLRNQPPVVLSQRHVDEETSVQEPIEAGAMTSSVRPPGRLVPSLVEIEMLFDCIVDLFDHRNIEVRTIAFEVVNLCLTYYGDQMSGSFRRKIFSVLENHNAGGDFALRQRSLRLLTQDGRNLEPFSVELGWLLLQWLEHSDDQRDLVSLIQSILRRSPLALDLETIIAVTSIICGRCDLAWSRGDIESCKRFLNFFHILATHQLEHAVSTTVCLRTLCCMVNADGHGTWSIMKSLLNGSAGFQVLRGLINLLETPQLNNQWVLRGAVFFVGMSCWGSQRVARLDVINWAPILLALESVLLCNNGVVIFEVILSLQRLIKKYGDGKNGHDTKRIVVEWDIILRIFKELRPWLSMNDDSTSSNGDDGERQHATAVVHPALPVGPISSNLTAVATNAGNNSPTTEQFSLSIHQTRIPKELLDTLAVVEELVAQGRFAGEVEEFFNVLEDYLPYLNESSTLFLLKHRAKSTHPAYHIHWLKSLETVVTMFFADDSMPPTVRLEALEVLQLSLWSSRNICEDRVIDDVLLPMLSDVYEDHHVDIRHRGLELITEVARHLESIKFDALMDILVNAVTMSEYEDAQELAMSGITSLFSSYFDHLPHSRALRMYEVMAATVETHRLTAVRKIALSCLLNVCEATTDYRLRWRSYEDSSTSSSSSSRFLYCARSAVHNPQTGACVPVAKALRALLTLVSTETHAELFRMAVDGLRRMLVNRVILAEIDLSDMTSKLVSCIDYRAFGRAAVSDEVFAFFRQMEINQTTDGPSTSTTKVRCLTETDIAQYLNHSDSSMKPTEPDAAMRSPRASVRESAATLVKFRFMTMGLQVLELLAASYAASLSTDARQQLVLCLIGALDVKLSVAEKDTFASSSSESLGFSTRFRPNASNSTTAPVLSTRVVASSASVRPRSSTKPPSELVSHASKPVSPSFGFTSRVLSRLQSTAQHGNLFHVLAPASKASPIHDSPRLDDRVQLQRVLRLLFDAEFAMVHVVTNAISLLALHHQEVAEHLDLLLQSCRVCFTTVEGDFRSDVYTAIVMMLQNVLASIRTALEFSIQKQLVEVLLLGFQCGKAKSMLYICYQLLCRVILQCDVNQRVELASAALPTLRHCLARSQTLLVECAIDFLMNYAYSRSIIPPSALRNTEARSISTEGGLIRSWVYQNAVLTIAMDHDQCAQMTIRRSNCTMRWKLEAQYDAMARNGVKQRDVPAESASGTISTTSKPRSADRVVTSHRQTPPRSKTLKTGIKTRHHRHMTPEMYLWKSKAATNRKHVTFESSGVLQNPSVALPPLPAYDGDGGSPSYFCDLNHSSTDDGELIHEQTQTDRQLVLPVIEDSLARLTVGGSKVSSHQSQTMMDPTYLMMQLFDLTAASRPQLLANGQALSLALNVLDRTPEFETHKIGLLYVKDPHQKSEGDILSNIGGSLQYLQFLRGLGTITKLQGFHGYSGGLDVVNDSDGRFALVYKDECTQIMFHVATMMVNAESNESNSGVKKKRHIGNDFVHVVYKECDDEYDVQTLSGQFNDVHIVVQPLNEREFRTHVHCKPGILPFGPLYGTQIVSSAVVSEAVRLTCVHANLACRAFHQELVGFSMNCEERLKQIKQMGLRYATEDEWTLDTH